ncbi:MAG: hypothetical protein P4L86_05700, partial [Mycobacterium sp.]|nr:hypothetical protein [Mycobacterium sp.]
MTKKKKSIVREAEAAPIATVAEARAWAAARRVTEIECLVPDLAGVARGKIMPSVKFFEDTAMALPSSIFMQTISGEYPEEQGDFRYDPSDGDLVLQPDFSTLCEVPWASDPTAQVIHDAHFHDGRPVEIAPRQVLKRVIDLYRKRGWIPVVAPELEFYLTALNPDPDLPLTPPSGRSGRAETSPQPYGLEAITEYEDLIEMIYEYAETAEVNVDTMIHESGTAQLEINFLHGDPVRLADQVLVFKRIVRQVALQHGVYATF